MTWGAHIKDVRNLPSLGLLIVIFLSLLLLVVINFYSLKTMSSVRAYINGESHYSKGEKDATQSLISFIQTSNPKYWDDFEINIAVPLGDSAARVGILRDSSDERVKRGFLRGNNHAEDVTDMIWLFKTFKNVPLMADPIAIWGQGDSLISQKHLIAKRIKAAVESGTIETKKFDFINELNQNSQALTKKEIEFSESLGSVARKIRSYLFYSNAIIILLMLGIISFYAMTMLNQLKHQNAALKHANKELDRIAYGVSHDLRAPINSMLGLVNLARGEKDEEKMATYIEMMRKALITQERFIKEMIAFSKENRKVLKKEIVDLNHIIEQVINMHKHMSEAENIVFSMSVGVHRVFTDAHRLEIILNNLVSNAIKYHDQSKPNKYIKIKTYSDNDKVCIDVADNGLGIDIKDQSKIFEMYYMSQDREKGSGLGLFIVKEAISKLNGEIRVKSTKGAGSTFTLVLNK